MRARGQVGVKLAGCSGMLHLSGDMLVTGDILGIFGRYFQKLIGVLDSCLQGSLDKDSGDESPFFQCEIRRKELEKNCLYSEEGEDTTSGPKVHSRLPRKVIHILNLEKSG